MSELKPCPFCGLEAQTYSDGNYTVVYCNCINCDPIDWDGVNPEIWNTRPIEDALRAELEKRTAELHYANTACMEMKRELDRLNAEIKTTDDLLKEATETIGAVIACCTYNSNDDAKIGIYGIDEKAFTKIDQFITHYNDAVSTGKVSIDVKRDLSDAEIEELGARAAESKQFCPNCEAETPCTHEAELYVCDICGEDFAKYIVSRNCNVSDVSVTQNVLTDVKTGQSVEIETCSWIQEDDPEICCWETRCGNSFYFTEGTPADNRMKYCCYCGKLLKQED